MSAPTPPLCVECGVVLYRVEHRSSEYLRYDRSGAYDSIDASEGLGGETSLRCMACGGELDDEATRFFYETWAVMIRLRAANARGVP